MMSMTKRDYSSLDDEDLCWAVRNMEFHKLMGRPDLISLVELLTSRLLKTTEIETQSK